MNTEVVKELLNILDGREFSEIEIEDGDFKLRVKRGGDIVTVTAPVMSAPAQAVPSPEDDISLDFNKLDEAVTPVAGVFYAASAPDAAPYVKVGDKVKKGDVLCIVEAMKTMNEVLSEFDGEIADCCVANGEFVEYGQVLFKIF